VEVVHARCAGMDISKTDAKVCVRIAGAGRRKTAETVTTWGAMTGQILTLRDHLAAEKVTCVVMEATSVIRGANVMKLDIAQVRPWRTRPRRQLWGAPSAVCH
jgi:hypothetical protein